MPENSRRWLRWQAALVVLPVAVLSVTGLVFVEQDRASIELQARQQAQSRIRLLVWFLNRDLTERFGRLPREYEGVISSREIGLPRDYGSVPIPAQWPAQLPPPQSALWASVQQATFERRDPVVARHALAALANGGASTAARANAEYRLLLLGASQQDAAGVAARAVDLARRYPDIVTESGTPLADLAVLLALQHSGAANAAAPLIEVKNRADKHPSFLTPELFSAAERLAPDTAKQLRAEWAKHEKERTLLRALLRGPLSGDTPSETWLEADGEVFLALCDPVRGVLEVKLIPAARVERTFQEALDRAVSSTPDYAKAVFVIGGKRIPSQPGAAPLAAADGAIGGPAQHAFQVRLELADPERMYAPYRRRTRFVAALILSSAATVLVGLVNLWRGFRRQARLSEMQSNFVSSVSHELRAPIAAVGLMAESLDGGRVIDDAKQREYFRLIVQECRRLGRLVENVLDFSRVDQGRKQYQFESVDVVTLVRHTIAVMHPTAAERRVDLSATGLPESLQQSWDGHAIEQALVNLIDNAIQHSPSGATVAVELELPESAPVVRLLVADQGPGIPVEEQPRIFERFYRQGSELRRETKGVGIGLSIVKQIVEAHGGRVLLESEVGKGSRFGIEIPKGVE